MASRKAELVPQRIPKRVRYVFDSNEHVNGASEALQKAVGAGDAAILKDKAMVLPGAYNILGQVIGLKSNMTVLDPGEMKKGKLFDGPKMGFISSTEQRTKTLAEVSRLLKDDGGFVVRALETEEMAYWWIFIMFDIEEPAFVLASKGGRYRFVVEIDSFGKIAILDELNNIPKKS